MSIPQTPSPLANILTSKTYNAAWFTGPTKEAQITATIAAAVTDGALYVYVPANMLPYNAALVTFNTSVKMLREGGNFDGYDVKAYGAAGDGITNDSPAVQVAMTAASGSTLLFPSNNTYLFATEIAGVSNILVLGYNVTIKSTTRIRSYFFFGGKTNIKLRGLTFDLGQSILSQYTQADYDAAIYIGGMFNGAVYADSSSNIDITDCLTQNLYTIGYLFYNCAGYINLRRNTHTSPIQTQKINMQQVHIQTCFANITIDDNIFDNAAPSSADFGVAGVYTSGLTGTFTLINSTFKYCGRNSVGGHQLGAYSSYGDVAQGNVHHNNFLNCLQQVIRLTTCHHMNVHHNYITMANVAGDNDQIISIEGTTTLGVAPFGCDDIKIHHNTFIDAFFANRRAVFAGAYDWGYPLKDIFITNNTCIGMKYVILIDGAITRLRVEDNNATGAAGNIITYIRGTIAPTSTYGTQAASFIRELSIKRNILDGTGTSGAIPIFPNLVTYTGIIGKIEIEDNTVQILPGPSAAAAIAYRGVATQGQLIVRRNKTDQYALVADLATGADLTYEQNQGRNWTGATPESISAFTTVARRDNRFSTGVRSGRAILVAGTVLVATSEILTGDNVLFTIVAPTGAQGFLSLGAIVNKTSFVINSTNVGDTSTVFWEIVH